MDEKQTLVTVQMLRGLAALIVAIGHAMLETNALKGNPDPFAPVWLQYGFGVDIFFVISGFIMMHTSGARFGTPGGARKFFVSRLIRIVPLYWALTTAMLALMFVLPGLLKTTSPDWSMIVGSYLFVPVPNWEGEALPLLAVGWTLNYEMFFYAIFALAIMLPRRAGVTVTVALFGSLAIAGALFRFEDPVLRFWTDAIILEFCFGMLLGVAAPRLAALKPRTGLLLMLVGLAAFGALHGLLSPAPRFLAFGIPATLLVAGAIVLDLRGAPLRSQLLEAIGNASYSLYLSHMFVVRGLSAVWNRAAFVPSSLLFCAVAIIAAIVVALVVARWFELPLHRAMKQRLALDASRRIAPFRGSAVL